MAINFNPGSEDGFVYYGESDFLAQIAYELANCPDSCFTVNVEAWYNALYSALSTDGSCSYQVRINEELCPKVEINDDAGLLDLLFNLSGFDVQNTLLDFLIAQAIDLGVAEGSLRVRELRTTLTRKFNEARRS